MYIWQGKNKTLLMSYANVRYRSEENSPGLSCLQKLVTWENRCWAKYWAPLGQSLQPLQKFYQPNLDCRHSI